MPTAGKMTLKDMNDYDVIWSDPIIGAYGDYQIAGYAPPALGGTQTIEALNLLKAADLRQFARQTLPIGRSALLVREESLRCRRSVT